jgi:hypothetical protein
MAKLGTVAAHGGGFSYMFLNDGFFKVSRLKACTDKPFITVDISTKEEVNLFVYGGSEGADDNNSFLAFKVIFSCIRFLHSSKTSK